MTRPSESFWQVEASGVRKFISNVSKDSEDYFQNQSTATTTTTTRDHLRLPSLAGCGSTTHTTT